MGALELKFGKLNSPSFLVSLLNPCYVLQDLIGIANGPKCRSRGLAQGQIKRPICHEIPNYPPIIRPISQYIKGPLYHYIVNVNIKHPLPRFNSLIELKEVEEHTVPTVRFVEVFVELQSLKIV